jgi:hypothetical protein
MTAATRQPPAARARTIRAALGGGALLALAACLPAGAGPRPTAPQARPETLSAPEPSARSELLSRHYARLQSQLLAKGLLRTDGGGMDTPHTAAMLVRNFERIALFDEYQRGAGLTTSDGKPGVLRRWDVPVRLGIEFGASVPPGIRRADRATLSRYATRLARLTGHPIRMVDRDPNFLVLVLGEDDRPAAKARVRAMVPDVNPSAMRLFDRLPRAIHCFVFAFSGADNDAAYRRAVAVIRAEHPDLLRRSCYHEEIAQGLGLPNDSPEARPSIFNDDDEFALLTTHDEKLMQMLYDPRLRPGMSPAQARPILRRIAAGLTAGAS